MPVFERRSFVRLLMSEFVADVEVDFGGGWSKRSGVRCFFSGCSVGVGVGV